MMHKVSRKNNFMSEIFDSEEYELEYGIRRLS